MLRESSYLRYLIVVAAFVSRPAFAQKTELVVDGRLNDPLWQHRPPEQLVSGPVADPAQGGEIRAIVAGRYLCVAARLPEPTGRFTARLTGRNPSWEEEDAFRILVGSNIGYTDRIIQVNPLGGYSIEKAVHVSYRSQTVFPYADEWDRTVLYRDADKFLVASVRSDHEWVAEVAIPLNQLSAPGSPHVFVSIERIRATRPGAPQQRWHWPALAPAARIPVATTIKWDAPEPGSSSDLAGSRPFPLQAGWTRELPALDSSWDDAAWRNVPVLDLLRDETAPRRPGFATSVKLLHDGGNLAILARCIEPGRIVATVAENDGPLTQDDSFQVYLSTSGSSYAQYAVNAAGYLLDSTGFAGGPRLSRAREWTSGARTSVHKTPGAWFVRLNIPLEAAANVLGETGVPAEWRLLLTRFRPARDGEAQETSVLPVIESETALCPARYQRLLLITGSIQQTPAVIPLDSFDSRVIPPAQRKEKNLPGMLERQLRARTQAILESEKHAREQLLSREAWERFRDPRLQALAKAIGPFPARNPLATRVTKEFRGQGYRRQDLVYQSRPGLWVPANLYLPEVASTHMPGIVIIHSLHRPKTQAELQDMGMLWARAGSAVLIMDQIGYGERVETYPWNREAYHARYVMGMQLYLAGENLMNWMVWDVLRGVDLLLERKDVDPEKMILVGAVAGGGDPAAVAAALDHRIAAVIPFNFGEATPPEGNRRWPRDLADPGWGSWDPTRNLPGSIAHQFFPWMIDASVAPRRFIYSYELGWNVEEQPAWARYRRVFDFYGMSEHLGEAHGFGPFPGPGECANIGPAQRAMLYPYLTRWFDIPAPPREPDDRRPEDELLAISPAIARQLSMRTIHDLARETATARLAGVRAQLAGMASDQRRRWVREHWAAKLGDIQPAPHPAALSYPKTPWHGNVTEAITLEVEPGILVPMLLLHPAGPAVRRSAVIAIAGSGKEAFLHHRGAQLEALLKAGIEVCLPDVRGTGETSPDARSGLSSRQVTLAATELMLDNTLLGARLKDLRTVLVYLQSRPDIDAGRIALWGDSFTALNPSHGLLDEMQGWRIGPQIQHLADPLGGLLAVLGALYEDRVAAVAARGGLSAFLSVLDDAFAYISGDVIVPGILEVGDLPDVVATLSPRPVLLERQVDGRNRLAPGAVASDETGERLRRWLVPQLSGR